MARAAQERTRRPIPTYIAVVTMNVKAFTISTVPFALITATNSVTMPFTAVNGMVTASSGQMNMLGTCVHDLWTLMLF
jgi:hypothetical protein